VCVCECVSVMWREYTRCARERRRGGNGWGPTPPTRVPSASFFIFRTLCKVCIKLLFLRLLFVFLICSEYFSFHLLYFSRCFGSDNDILVRILIHGSWSTDPYFWLTDLAPDPALFINDLQDANKEYINYFAYYFLKVHILHSSKIKSQRSHKTVESSVYYYFIFSGLLKEDPNPDPDSYLWLADPDPGGPKTLESGPGTLIFSFFILSWILFLIWFFYLRCFYR
jgi:hypothetical protein